MSSVIEDRSKLYDRDALAVALSQFRPVSGHVIVFTNGCFDILHAGHVDLLFKARSFGTRLIVALNSDESVLPLNVWTS